MTLREALTRSEVTGETLNQNSDVERGIRAVAFLMDSMSQGGAKSLDGELAVALANVLRAHADYLGWRAGRNDHDGFPIFGSPEADGQVGAPRKSGRNK